MRAACHRCGGIKAGPFLPCPDCHHTPRADDRAIAWFSSAHLSPEELVEAAKRIKPESSRTLRRLIAYAATHAAAGRAGGGAPMTPDSSGPGIGSVALTPLVGLSVWWATERRDPPHDKRSASVSPSRP